MTDTITAIKKALEVADTLQNYTDIDAAEGANSDVVVASYAAVKTIEDLASTLESSQRENEALKEEIGRLEDENSDLRYQPWPEWARAVLKVIRSGSGYDGYDDATEGVDMPLELSEHLSEMQNNADRQQARAEAAEAEVKRYREALHIISAGHACPIELANNALRPAALSSTGDTHGN